ncbi:MAG: nuclear transport factor 2 family protein [Anaerolineae bacterium]|nr:nuclear transport factor 2 family protein [Anaerolineae bacterium]
MMNREIIEKYFEYANAGEWDKWCDLFSEDAVYEEQLAGRIEGRETLRPMMAGFPNAYKSFVNTPRHFIVEADRAAAVSHISAQAMKYPDEKIEAEAMLFLQMKDGLIVFAQNFHDSKPFAPFLRQISEG